MKQEGNKPEKRFRAGAISATVWKNAGQKDGKLVEFRTVSLQRVYKDKEGEWKHTTSLRVSDLPKANLVLSKAYEYLVISENNEGAGAIEEEEIFG